MPMGQFFDPSMFGLELAYTTIIVILCFLVYHKTKEMYELTKHKGIHHFRNAFLFFGLSYVGRFLVHIFQLGMIALDIWMPRSIFFPIMMIIVGYFSTMALFFLGYSVIWKKIEYSKFIVFANIIATIVSLFAFISRSPMILSVVQLPLLVLIVVLILKKHSATKKVQIKTLYISIAAFWLISLFLVGPKRMIPFELIFLLQGISIALFAIIYHKVTKWTT